MFTMDSRDECQILPTEPDDLPVIFHFFESSIIYQEKNAYPSWRNYDRDAVIRDMENKRQFKVILNQQIAIVFSIRYDDKIIWREHDHGNSLYLHRIVVNPAFKGQKSFGRILNWSVTHCSERGLSFIRMDTWADNPVLIEYYKSFGFRIVETFTTPDVVELPVHNRNLRLTLLEYPL